MNHHINTSYIGPDELIYNNDGGIHSGGFSVNSIMLKNGLSPIMTMNNMNVNDMQIGGNKVSDLFNNLVIPNWSLSYNYKNGVVYEGGSHSVYNEDDPDHDDDDEILEEDLHEKLLNLVKVNEKEMKEAASNKKITKKHFTNNSKSKKNVTKKKKKVTNLSQIK
jgi:hypothetical protein